MLGDFPQSSLKYSFGTLTQRNAFGCMPCRAWTRTRGRLLAVQSTVSDAHGSVCIGLVIGRAISRLPHTSLRASLGQPFRLHPASVLAGLAAGAGLAALPCSYPLLTGCMASRCVKDGGCARHLHPFPTLCSGRWLPVPPLTPLPARIHYTHAELRHRQRG